MTLTEKLTLKKLTPPGYFNLSDGAPVAHRHYMDWFQTRMTWRGEQGDALKTLVLTPWLVDFNDSPRAPWLNFLLSQYGIGFFEGTNNQAAYMYQLISGAWYDSTIKNIKKVLEMFCLPPFGWFDGTFLPQILSGSLVPSLVDTGFIVYSTSGTAPATPASVTYTARSWIAPSGWTRAASSAKYYSRGYRSGGNIVWCAPRAVSDFENPAIWYFSASVPVAVASAGTVCFVDNDGSGDENSIYYSDGSAWRKNSEVNVSLGLNTVTDAIAVWAPNPSSVSYAISSAVPPPADGSTAGYGTFAGWANTSATDGRLRIQLHQLSGGNVAISTLLSTLRRVKPIGIMITAEIDGTTYTITDARQSA